jgi:hypothetical protein
LQHLFLLYHQSCIYVQNFYGKFYGKFELMLPYAKKAVQNAGIPGGLQGSRRNKKH